MVKPHRGRFLLGTFFLLIGSGGSLLYPKIAGYAINEGISDGSIERLDLFAMILMALFVIQSAATWVRHYLMSWIGERVVSDLRKEVFGKLLSLPPSWFNERRTGELVGRLASDVTTIENVVGSELSIALRNVVQLIGGLALLFYENVRLSAYILLVIPPLIVGVVFLGRKIRRMSKRVQDSLADASGRVQEALGAIDTVQIFGQENAETKRYNASVDQVFADTLHLTRWRATFISISGLAGFFAIAMILWLGGRAVVAGDISPGGLTTFLLYSMIVATALGSLTGIWSSLQKAAGATERLFEIVDEQSDIKSPETPAEMPRSHQIDLRNITFHYPQSHGDAALKDVSLTIREGEKVALVGPSGSGKTTITKLVARFYDPQEGSVELGGTSLASLSLEAMRARLAFVNQEPVLLSGSIRENLIFGKENASDEDIRQALRDASAEEFVSNFQFGVDTQVGERGVQLSGGQKQRIAIARALLRNPEILVLDEATSNLDAKSETVVQRALETLMQGRTTLIVAHRLATVQHADRIVVMDRGQILHIGTHEELMKKSELYRHLVELQQLR